ncbi:hypothetical protein K437DRAFT_256122 [Tilletiaria anomala UBC 951]|uniref:Uncharacterized protein n=1 Tax=Tilletiaria anomala (strain ATCC 24038 / CBS 436.72 / UBC 951) TaxID=1037660 RepID=A0A066W744_TILAU|nr:uncharacterized protein K437DRAFT_256122 [Tilletiaria anomala UBC 951]KDN46615.1 hypothetical protein K437DRAFT_256122 [Tilletiaria anomala UBC 951]
MACWNQELLLMTCKAEQVCVILRDYWRIARDGPIAMQNRARPADGTPYRGWANRGSQQLGSCTQIRGCGGPLYASHGLRLVASRQLIPTTRVISLQSLLPNFPLKLNDRLGHVPGDFLAPCAGQQFGRTRHWERRCSRPFSLAYNGRSWKLSVLVRKAKHRGEEPWLP